MNNKDLLVENSLYKTPAEMNDLLMNKEGVANAFFINLFGTLGLLKISSKRGTMKTHLQDDGQLRLSNIADTNKDISLSVKLAVSAGILKFAVAQEITRLLFALKSKQIKGEDLSDATLRDILSKIQYKSHRPHVSLIPIIEGFADGTLNIQQVAKQMFLAIKARKKELLPFATEFYDLAKQYSVYFAKVDDTPMTAKAQLAKATQATPSQIQPQAPIQTPAATVQPVTIVQSTKPVAVQTVPVPQQPISTVTPPAVQPAAKEALDQFTSRVWNKDYEAAGLLNQAHYDEVKKELDDIHSGGYAKALMEIVNSKRSEFTTKHQGDLEDFTTDGFGAVIKALSPDAWFAYNLYWLQGNITGIESVTSDTVALMGDLRASGVKDPELIRPFASLVQMIIGFWITYLVNAKSPAEYKRGVTKIATILKLQPAAANAILIFDPVAWANVLKKNNINEDAAFKAFAGPLFAGVGEFKTGNNGLADWKGMLKNYKVDIPEKKVNVETVEAWFEDVLEDIANEFKTGWKLFTKVGQTTASTSTYTIEQLSAAVWRKTDLHASKLDHADIAEVKNELMKFNPDLQFSIHALLHHNLSGNKFTKLRQDEVQEFMGSDFGVIIHEISLADWCALWAWWLEANVKKLSDFDADISSVIRAIFEYNESAKYDVQGVKAFRGIDSYAVVKTVCETVINSWVERIDTSSKDAYYKSLTTVAKQFTKITVESVARKITYPIAVLDYMEKVGYVDDMVARVVVGVITLQYYRIHSFWGIESQSVEAIIPKLRGHGIMIDPQKKVISGLKSAETINLLYELNTTTMAGITFIGEVSGDYATAFTDGYEDLVHTIEINSDYVAGSIVDKIASMPDFHEKFEKHLVGLLNSTSTDTLNAGREALKTVARVYDTLFDIAKKNPINLEGVKLDTNRFWKTVVQGGDTGLLNSFTRDRISALLVKQYPLIVSKVSREHFTRIGLTGEELIPYVRQYLKGGGDPSLVSSYLEYFTDELEYEDMPLLKKDLYTFRRAIDAGLSVLTVIGGLGIIGAMEVFTAPQREGVHEWFEGLDKDVQKDLINTVLKDAIKNQQVSKDLDHYDSVVDSILGRVLAVTGGNRHVYPWMYDYVEGLFRLHIPKALDNFPSVEFATLYADDDVVDYIARDRLVRDVNKIGAAGGASDYRSYDYRIIEGATEVIKRSNRPETIETLAETFAAAFTNLGQVKDVNSVARLGRLLKAIDDKNQSAAERIFKSMSSTARGKLVLSIAEEETFNTLLNRLVGTHQEIRPEIVVKPSSIPGMLAKNNINLTKIVSVDAASGKSFRDVLASSVDDSILPDPKVVRVDNKDQEVLDRASARLNGEFRSNKKHGSEGLKVLAIFDTSISDGPEWEAFSAERAENGDENDYFPTVWHGTGTVGGSFILRYGFKITKFDRETMAGRALGNGIYFARYTDKSLQYLRDDTSKITRQVGGIGYLFEMEAQTGRPAKRNSQPCGPDEGVTCDYRSGGFAEATNHQSFASPEWAVFKEKGQLRIKKVYKVEIVPMSEWKANCKKYGYTV